MSLALEELIKTRILRGEYSPGAPLKTERHYAGEMGLSCNKVHRTLQKLVKEGYLNSRRGSGYFVNINQEAQPSDSVLKVAYLRTFSNAIANMLNIKAGQQNIWINIIPDKGGDLNPAVERIVREKSHDAILIDRREEPCIWGRGLTIAMDMHFPVIFRGGCDSFGTFPSIIFNSYEFGFMAAKILQRRGYRKILYFGYEPERAPSMKLRLEGFQAGCDFFGLEYQTLLYNAAQAEMGTTAEKELAVILERRQYDAVFAGSGSFTHIAARAFHGNGIMPPRDMGFLGTQFQKVESQNFIADCISDNWEFAEEKTLELIREFVAVRNGGCTIGYTITPKYLEGESL